VPVDQRHAFAGGRVRSGPSALDRLLRTRRDRMWRAFERDSVHGRDLQLGDSAWCANDGPAHRVRIGNRVVCRGIIRRESFGDGLLEIEDDVYIGDDCILSCASRIVIGTATLLGHGVQIFDNNSHPLEADERAADWDAIRRGGRRRDIAAEPVMIGKRAWIGFGSIVLKGVTIGDEAIVGAGSVVTRDVPNRAVVAGNPAQRLA
jgi:acetyltransferase-like isoleucine patch superfamily enzyme